MKFIMINSDKVIWFFREKVVFLCFLFFRYDKKDESYVLVFEKFEVNLFRVIGLDYFIFMDLFVVQIQGCFDILMSDLYVELREYC